MLSSGGKDKAGDLRRAAERRVGLAAAVDQGELLARHRRIQERTLAADDSLMLSCDDPSSAPECRRWRVLKEMEGRAEVRVRRDERSSARPASSTEPAARRTPPTQASFPCSRFLRPSDHRLDDEGLTALQQSSDLAQDHALRVPGPYHLLRRRIDDDGQHAFLLSSFSEATS